MFKVNEGPVDRALRIIFGILLLFIGVTYFAGLLSVLFIVLGIIGLITGITGFCGLYALLGINTCPKNKQ
ncbi:MAG: DUF2892 domain-containing protein [Endomicrobia bacterium]|nr:DUF2892 domain-containing protein [Endomicrobiia bacterium]MCX7910839.1 DUF2892 domain-containing protein [Endomicrobiia bacterium]MDW8055930.1 DUF2892 domain-containing protein [Elusimicrobiota bacterium]